MNDITIEEEGREIQDIQSEYIEDLKRQISILKEDQKMLIDDNDYYQAENERLTKALADIDG